MRSRTGIVLVAVVTACGARTPLEVGSSSASDAGPDANNACIPTHPSPGIPCSAWRVAGADQIVSAASPPGVGIGLSAPIAAGCGVLVAWYTLTGPRAPTLSWSTRSLAFDGTPRADIQPHPALTSHTMGSGEMSLAANGANVAGLVVDSMVCSFAPLDANGADVGPVVQEGSTGCGALAAEGDGFSYLAASAQDVTPVTLTRIDARGAPRSTTTLATPAGRALWNRFVFDDGSFLLNTFREDPMTTVYTDWLQHFDARGAALAAEAVVGGVNTAPVHVAATATGVLAGWQWSSLNLVPLNRDAAPTGAPQALPLGGAPYGMTLVSVPNGDAMVLWLELAAPSGFNLFVQAIAPNGTPRAPATLVRKSNDQSRVYAVVAPQGDRALLVMQDGGVRALPLECVR